MAQCCRDSRIKPEQFEQTRRCSFDGSQRQDASMQVEREAADRSRDHAGGQVEVRKTEATKLHAFSKIKFQPQPQFRDKAVGGQADIKNQASKAWLFSHHSQRLAGYAGKA